MPQKSCFDCEYLLLEEYAQPDKYSATCNALCILPNYLDEHHDCPHWREIDYEYRRKHFCVEKEQYANEDR